MSEKIKIEEINNYKANGILPDIKDFEMAKQWTIVKLRLMRVEIEKSGTWNSRPCAFCHLYACKDCPMTDIKVCCDYNAKDRNEKALFWNIISEIGNRPIQETLEMLDMVTEIVEEVNVKDA